MAVLRTGNNVCCVTVQMPGAGLRLGYIILCKLIASPVTLACMQHSLVFQCRMFCCCALLRCALHCAALCCALHCAVPRCTVLCCAVLCCAVSSPTQP
jgi:hypothetical protein